jgi:hypothetical protein
MERSDSGEGSKTAYMRKFWIAMVMLVACAEAADKAYLRGALTRVEMTDLATPLTIPSTSPNVPGVTATVRLGVLYQFTVDAEGITYLAACTSKKKKSFAADWVINDP